MKKLFDEIPRLENEHVILRRVTEEDAEALRAMTLIQSVYRYLPTFLFEQQDDDIHAVIREIYGDIFRKKQSLILAVCRTEAPEIFCGLAEFYGFRRILSGVPEDWGYPKPVKADKWVRRDRPERENWRFHTGALRSAGRIHS